MDLTASSSGIHAVNKGLKIKKELPGDRIVALAGNPNVGKSTVFNELTGLNQHTGNWPGKTVTGAQGRFQHRGRGYILVDLPGTYSLMAHSVEEEVARDFLCFGESDAVVVVCDATCLERNLNLVFQALEITSKVVVCVNLMDEAAKKKIRPDLPQLSRLLGVPVIGTNARDGQGIPKLIAAIEGVCAQPVGENPPRLRYSPVVEEAIGILEPVLTSLMGEKLNARWLALRLLTEDTSLIQKANEFIGFELSSNPEVMDALAQAKLHLSRQGLGHGGLDDQLTAALMTQAETVHRTVVQYGDPTYYAKDRRLDKILTSRFIGIPIMLLLLCGVFWLTIVGANFPSQMLSRFFWALEERMTPVLLEWGTPLWLHDMLVLGVYRVLAWVVSVMLPPMAIFFPLFTLLEDFGYLPRVAFNLDHHFKKACACGKQALTMAMGFGCNAAGVVGCRIIDSPRERLIAIITNSLVPCNGRFPTLIALISMFFVGGLPQPLQSLTAALLLLGLILLGIWFTFIVSHLLSRTILKGVPSSFTLELPSYRRPKILRVLIRSLFDRTLFVLARAAVVAAPAGLIIWLLASISIGDSTLLAQCARLLDPFGRLLGMDGVILLGFILGFPANEIVMPIIIMTYLAQGSLVEMEDLTQLHTLLMQNGWTWVTAASTALFCLVHWPCSTTCLTIGKETRSLKWTLVSFGIPTFMGITLCFLFATAMRLLGWG